MAILGEGFKDYVKEQINIRQEKLSAYNKDTDLLKYLTSATPFIRLTSGVNVAPEVLSEYGLPTDLADNKLAAQYTLEAARFRSPGFLENDSLSNVGTLTSGVGFNDLNTSYGFLSDSNYGYVPPPGITQMSAKTLNRGTIREATIQILCHNIKQFYVINLLFLKLKYSLLLEWGHSVYYNNEGNLVEGFDIPNLSIDFLKGNVSQNEFLAKIEEKRKLSCGNYDAFFGWIKNFQWEAQENGSYSITVNAISTGDVIESLRINTYTNPDSAIEDENDQKKSDPYRKSIFHKILGAIRNNKTLQTKYFLDGFRTDDKTPALNTDDLLSLIQETYKGENIVYNYKTPNLDTSEVSNEGNAILSDKEAIRADFSNFQTTGNTKGKNVQNAQYYIKLGALLRIIQSFLLWYDTSKTDNIIHPAFQELSKKLAEAISIKEAKEGKHPPVFYFDTNYDTNECLTTINQLPVDPRVALIPIARVDTKEGPMKYVSSKFRIAEKAYVAKTMHIYVNIDHIISILDNNVDENNDIVLLDFLNALLSDVSNALGGINQFELDYDDATNTFSIIDNALIPIKYQVEPPKMSVFNINAFNPTNNTGSSFVTNFGLKSDVYSSIGNAIALSAQGESDTPTSVGSFNKGIVDRYLTKKKNLNQPTSKEELDALLQEKINVRTNFTAFAKKLTSTSKTALTPEDIDKYSTYVSSVLQADLEHAVITDQIAGTIFIPLNLNLTIDGLSGMRQYQTFKISENILPKEYYNRIKFITTTIEHKVDIKNWETTINTIGVPSKPKAEYRETPFSLVNPSSNKTELLNALGYGNLTEQQLIDAARNNVILANILELTP